MYTIYGTNNHDSASCNVRKSESSVINTQDTRGEYFSREEDNRWNTMRRSSASWFLFSWVFLEMMIVRVDETPTAMEMTSEIKNPSNEF